MAGTDLDETFFTPRGVTTDAQIERFLRTAAALPCQDGPPYALNTLLIAKAVPPLASIVWGHAVPSPEAAAAPTSACNRLSLHHHTALAKS
ncbi:hypothetical protein C8Q74DRAFT_683768 [Fomes fomentarius]|nr:hypothetical protein C8Q74DRAFT_683768 [Fomes fomentarius]